ncbi:hypothetical protein BROUX41_001859 [Berkeleyomyces rouxiae]|uniref:uncharacterized protein n=1 Tax=Berkeleyomyces rouxiae TaxID=2035830 RepID=UPI003B781DDC
MSVRDVTKDLNKLDKQLDALDEALKPLLRALNDSAAANMPLLDRAKLFTLANYALETLIFAGLRVEGADALNHPVYKTELMRVKQYFAKIEAVEKPPADAAQQTQAQQPSVRLNTEAATRIIKHGLSDDASIQVKLAEQVAKEKAKAFMRSLGSAKRPAADADTPAAATTTGEESECSTGGSASDNRAKKQKSRTNPGSGTTTTKKKQKGKGKKHSS